MDHEIIFDGTEENGKLTSGAFIRAIRQQAMSQGKQSDDLWMAQLASGYLDGKALNWFEQLSEEVQDSWKLLRRALLQQWNPETAGSISVGSTSIPPASSPIRANSIVPTPAASAPPRAVSAAAPPLTTGADLEPPLVSISAARIGRIQILQESNNKHLGYVSRVQDAEGDFNVTETPHLAMKVELIPDLQHPRMRILSDPAKRFMGVVLHGSTAESIMTTTTITATMVPVTQSGTDWAGPPYHSGNSRPCDVYVLADGTVVLFWMDRSGVRFFPAYRSGPQARDYMCIFLHNDWLPDESHLMTQRQFTRVRFIFQPD